MAEYAELHCHTNFSFLDGASHPEELVEEAYRLGLSGLAVTDHDGLYGVVRFAVAARPLGFPTVFGAELTLGARTPPNGMADPPGEHLVVIGEGPAGYAGLARAISEAQMRGEKGAPRLTLEHLAAAPREGRASWWVLTGCRKGAVPAALVRDGPATAEHALGQLTDAFGRDRVLVELWDHGDPMDRPRNDALARIASRAGTEVVATNNVHYATPDRRRLADRARRRSAAGAAWTSSTAGCPPRPSRTCAARPSSSGASPATPVRSSALRRWPPPARSTCGSRCRTCPTTRCRRVTRT